MGDPLPVPPLRFPSESLPRQTRGYDRAATERIFAKVAASYEALWLQCSQLAERVKALEDQVARSEEEKQLVTNALVEVRDSGTEIAEAARREADAMLAKARRRADEIVADAEREARDSARRIASERESERARLEAEIARLRALAGDTHRELSAILLSALEGFREAANGAPYGRPEPNAPHHLVGSSGQA
jgi:cell division initiation protein